jgi:hypothetical protein
MRYIRFQIVGKLFFILDNWGTPKEFNEANVALRTVVKEEAPKAIETFTIGINGLDTNFAYLEIYWENSRVALKFEVPTQKKGNGKHRKLAGAAGDYFAAAQFYYQSNGDINKARTYIDKALEMSAENHFIFYARDH